MKTVIAVVTSIVLAWGSVLAVPVAANANDTPTVDYAEFAEVKIGYTLAQVGAIFDSAGVSTYAQNGILEKRYRVAYGEQLLTVGVTYFRRDGVLRVISKSATWTSASNPAHDPATKTEYLAIKQGMTLAQVRSIIGSEGTRGSDLVAQYSSYEDPTPNSYYMRVYLWPQVGGVKGDVQVQFIMRNGVYFVHLKGGVTWR